MTSFSNGVTRTDTVSDFFSMATSASEASKSIGAVYRVEVTPNPASFFWDGFRPLAMISEYTRGNTLSFRTDFGWTRLDCPVAKLNIWRSWIPALRAIARSDSPVSNLCRSIASATFVPSYMTTR